MTENDREIRKTRERQVSQEVIDCGTERSVRAQLCRTGRRAAQSWTYGKRSPPFAKSTDCSAPPFFSFVQFPWPQK